MRARFVVAGAFLLVACATQEPVPSSLPSTRTSAVSSPTASAAQAPASPSVDATVVASQTAWATASPLEHASPSPGEFGMIHSTPVGEAFPDGADTCENVGQVLASLERSDVGYRLSFPMDWYTNPETPQSPACTLFHPEPFDPTEPWSVAIQINMPPGGEMTMDFGSTPVRDADAVIEEYTVDGVPALRLAFTEEPAVLWVVGIGGSLPGPANDRPYLSVSLRPDAPGTFADILDRMIATLEVIESG